MSIPSGLRITLVGPATPGLLQHHFVERIESTGYPFPLLPQLANEYVRRGHHVEIVTSATDIADAQRFSESSIGLEITPARLRARDRALDFFKLERRRLADSIVSTQPDIIHAHWTYEFALAAIDSGSAPILVTVHDAPLTILRHYRDAYRLLRTIMAYKVRKRAPNLSAVSPSVAYRWRKQMLDRKPIPVIPNPMPDFSFPKQSNPSTLVILGVGDDSDRKNYKALLKAFPYVLAERDDAELRLVGPGLGPTGALAAWARANGIAKSVTFCGVLDRPTLAVELSRASIFCHPSLEESFGMVLLEALSAGLPVVAGAKSGGVPWVLFGGKAGLLVDVRRPHCIADGVLRVIRDPDIAVTPGFDLTAELQSRYSIETVADQYLQEYEQLIRKFGQKQ